MSFDIYLLAGPVGENLFDRTIVERAFAGIAEETTSDIWGLLAPGGGLCFGQVSVDQGPKIGAVSVNRPPGFPAFWDAMFDVLRQTRTILAWPAPGPGPTYCVANEDWKSYLGEEMSYMGEPAFVRSGADILAALDASGA